MYLWKIALILMMENKMSNTVSAISIKKLGYTPKELRALVEKDKGCTFIARIIGTAASVYTGKSKHGAWLGFEGTFSAANGKEEIFSAPAAYLPSNVATKLKELLDAGQVEVPVAVDVYVEESEKSASGYRYICRPILSAESQARMEKMQKALLVGLPQQSLALAAPKKKA
jgi:hypothetical protein